MRVLGKFCCNSLRNCHNAFLETTMTPTRSTLDSLLTALDQSLRSLWGAPVGHRPMPKASSPPPLAEPLTPHDQAAAGALMRVNHVGEVCAQALYSAQALTSPTPQLKAFFERARSEETDHLAWTRQRLGELGDRPSLLNPLWYAGAFALGLAAGRLGEAVSLGFVMETERQVEAHLHSHLDRLPAQDLASRAIVAQMAQDEANHGAEAAQLGGSELPAPVKGLMTAAAKVMTTVAHYV
jgi:ubiquinone biosynthesis monooxygenase Coq7